MKKIFYILASALFTACAAQSGHDGMITMETLLAEMTSYDAVVSYPKVPYKTLQTSSYDRRTVSPDKPFWFANNDGFGYERLDTVDGRIEKVLFEQNGPGAVTRIWMTTKDKRGTLRFYFDGSDNPEITIAAYDMDRFPVAVGRPFSLTHTHYVRDIEGVGGNTFFLPLPYAESCKITLEEPVGAEDIPRYYQITCRKYIPSAEVETFSIRKVREIMPLIESAAGILQNPPFFEGGTECTRILSDAGDCLELPRGNKAVRTMVLALSDCGKERIPEIMMKSRIQVSFDGVVCVDCPLDCFFGTGTGTPEVSGWYLEAGPDGRFVSRWVMPYSDRAEIRIVNGGGIPCRFTVLCHVDDFEFGENTLYFHATYREQEGIPVGNIYDSNDNTEWNFTDIRGKGIYCGDILSLYNHCPVWYGEGDEKIWIDGDTFPSIMGTGTEDYYNCSWAPVVPFDTPFGGAPRADEDSSHGYNTFMRTRNLDVMPFGEHLKFDLEMLGWERGFVDYRAAAYWYGTLESTIINQ